MLAPAAEPNGNGDASYAGLPQPDSSDVQQLPGQPYKDGRIRNPVPSKLKGKTSNASGRFSVMHMDIRGKDMAADRDLAAKRTSENTALAAKKAFENGYQPHRKSNWLRVKDDPISTDVPFTGTTPYNPALYGLKPAANPPKEKTATNPSCPLSPQETKEEQARLLTVLRSLQPLTVVDQLCKALAYFGGVPDAPPPQDGKFPESAEANGSGLVFVGWLAEIFPDLDAQGRRKSRPFRAPEPPAAQSTEKRGRGRPKGSKASKVRSDKGIKKGPKKNLLTDDFEVNGAENEDSWVDMDDTVMEESQDVVITGAQARRTPEVQVAADTETPGSSKKRGRPKGSKNRPKDGSIGDDFTSNPAPISALFSIGKKVGRPKGVKTKTKDAALASNNLVPATNGVTPAAAPEPQSARPQPAATMEPTPQADPEFALAALKAFNESQLNDLEAQANSFQPVNSAPAVGETRVPKQSTAKSSGKSQPAKKRKRTAKDIEAAGHAAAAATSAGTEPVSVVNQPPVAGGPAASTMDLTTPAAPPPKRQKKAKAKAKTAANSAPTADQAVAKKASQVNQNAVIPPVPVPAPVSVPTSTPATQPVEAQMYTSPTIEELEAQLEQHDEQTMAHSEVNTAQVTNKAKPSQSQPLQPVIQQLQPQQPSNSKQAQQAQQKGDQRAVARHRQQYQQQQQQQQQAVARTASPNISQMNTTSPHMSVQSASPSTSAVPSASPNLPQQHISNSQTPTSANSQIQNQQSRNTQSYYTTQTTSTQSSYGQQQSQQYNSPQATKQQFTVPQTQQQQSFNTTSQPAQQQQTYPSQQPQYSQQKQQSYSSQPQQQYTSPQQQYSSQRMQQQQQQQQYATSSAGTPSQTLSAQSPQYATSTASGYNSNDGSFRANSAAGVNFNSSAYPSNQASNPSRNNNLYSNSTTTSYANPTQQISSYAAAPRRTLPTTTSQHTSVQNVQSLPGNLSSFSEYGNLGFDSNLMANLDNPAGSHSSLGINTASYNMGASNVSRSSAGAGNFTFDSTLRNDGNSYFGLRR